MNVRWGLGPVFAYEWLTTSRRWQYYAGRSLFIALLLMALVTVWWAEARGQSHLRLNQLARVGENFFYAIIGTQLTLVLLVAPAVTAGSICVDKVRGTLLHLLVTDLSNAEIILGKLATRLGTVFGLVACGLPVMFLGMLVGGIDPSALMAASLITLGIGLLGGTLALTLSVWCTKTYEVLLATYLIWTILLLINPVWRMFLRIPAPSYVQTLDPFWLAFAPYRSPGATTFDDAVEFLGIMMGLSALLAVLAIWRVRKVATRQSNQPRKRRRWSALLSLEGIYARLPGPSLDTNPVLWREWHRKRGSWWFTLVWLVYGLAALGFTLYVLLNYTGMRRSGEMGPFVNAFQVAIGMLLAGVASVTALAEERERGGLPILLATPLSTNAILMGKWWGVYRKIFLLAILPGLLAALLGLRHSRWELALLLVSMILAYGAAITSLGLLLATWIGRQGRAIALQVVIFVVVTVGMIFVAFLFLQKDSHGSGLACASPWFGPGMLTAMIENGPSRDLVEVIGWCIFWVIFYTAGAILLYLATLATFNRCLGRISARRLPLPRLLDKD